MIIIYILGLILSFYLLAIISEDFFVPSLEKISEKLKLSSEMTGATFMAVGSSAPEFFTVLIALFTIEGASDIGPGTIVGSAIFNILVIIGASSLFSVAKLTWQPVVRDLFSYAFAIVVLLFVFLDGKVTVIEAAVFVLVYAIYIFLVSRWQKWFKYETPDFTEEIASEIDKNKVNKFFMKGLGFVIPDSNKNNNNYIFAFIISIAFIGVLSHTLVHSASHIGDEFELSATFMGLTILAAGTSIPDLLSSVAVAKKQKGDMAISNAVGSNIFDILFGLGAPWLIYFAVRGESSITIDNDNLFASIFLLFATVLAVFTLLALRKWKIGPKAGYILLFTYAAYFVYTFVSEVGL